MDTALKLVTFLDLAQRTVIGEDVTTGEQRQQGLLQIKNPVVVSTAQQMDPNTRQPTGQMALQLLPTFFKEFQGDKSQPVMFTYREEQITRIEFEGGFDIRLIGQYTNMFNILQQVAPTQPAAEGSKVIKLFDNEK